MGGPTVRGHPDGSDRVWAGPEASSNGPLGALAGGKARPGRDSLLHLVREKHEKEAATAEKLWPA